MIRKIYKTQGPNGLGMGWFFTQGQDIADSGIARALGLLAAAAVSLLSVVVYLITRAAVSKREEH